MSNCMFCGKPAGLFHNKHHECAEMHETGRSRITDLILGAPSSHASVQSTATQIRQVAAQSFISDSETRDLSVMAWSHALDSSLHDGILSADMEKRLVDLKEGLSLSSGDLLQTGAWNRVLKSAVLRDLMAGVIPKRIHFHGNLGLNFQKGEQVVWVFEQVDYLEEKTRREYVGRSGGVSVRVMKGVYYHVGGFKGQPIDRTERIHVDNGLVAVTTKQIYFSGSKKAFRIPYSKIVSFEPFSNGLGIMALR